MVKFAILLRFILLVTASRTVMFISMGEDIASTDLIAEGSTVLFTYLFGILLHPVLMFSTKKVISFLESVEAYDSKYPDWTDSTTLYTKWTVKTLIESVLLSSTPTGIICFYLTLTHNLGSQLHYFSFEINSTYALFPLVFLCFAFIEFAVAFIYIQLNHFSSLCLNRLKHLRKQLDENEKEFSLDKINWETTGVQYIQVEQLVQHFATFAGTKFILLYFSLVVSLVGLSYYYVFVGDKYFGETTSIVTNTAIAICFFRMIFLAGIGESFLKEHERLKRRILTIYHLQCSKMPRDQLIKVFTVVIAKSFVT